LGDSASTRTCLLDSAVQQAADLGARVDTSWRCEARSHRVFRWPTRRHGGAVKRRGDRGWTVRGGSTPARAFQRPHRAHRRTNSPTKCEPSTETSIATGTGVQTLVAATIEMSSMRGRSWIPSETSREPGGRVLFAPSDRLTRRRLTSAFVAKDSPACAHLYGAKGSWKASSSRFRTRHTAPEPISSER
jgi:hypothetical protein